jgi:G6PDH family F420-dependent oxidoreductase
MLEEAVGIIRQLWRGEMCSHDGLHFTVDNARIYDLPNPLPPINVAAAGAQGAEMAARIGDGLVNYSPDAKISEAFDASGGRGKPKFVQLNVCWAEDEAEARRTAHAVCPTVGLPGELGQQLPMPAHYEQAITLVTEEKIADAIVCGPDPERHMAQIQKYIDAGYDHIHVDQVGPDQEGFFRFYEKEILPKFR